MVVKIDSNFRIKQLTEVPEIARLINDSGGISRQDLIFTFGSKMVKPLKTIESTKTFKLRKLSGISNRPVKVYSTNNTTYDSAINNHYRALSMYCLRESGCKISHPKVLSDEQWSVDIAVKNDATLTVKTTIVTAKNYDKLKKAVQHNTITPLYIFTSEELFLKVRQQGLLYGDSLCVVIDGKKVNPFVMNFMGITKPFNDLKQISEFKKIESNASEVVANILKSYDISKFTKRKKDDK